jgi:hypothetical protein
MGDRGDHDAAIWVVTMGGMRNTGTGPSEVMVLRDGARAFLAVFNFSGAPVTRTLSLARAGLEPRRLYSVTDLWSGETSTAQGTLTVALEQDSAKLFQLE